MITYTTTSSLGYRHSLAQRARRFCSLCGPVILLLFASLGFVRSATGATVTTDQSDYPPGSTVTITGNGFGSNDTVTVQVVHPLDIYDTYTSLAHAPWNVSADSDGNFVTTWIVPLAEDEGGATLLVTAFGDPSGLTATTTFTDSVPAPGLAPVSPPAGGFAIDGDLLANTPGGTGDWVSNSAPGGFVLYTNGTPVDSTATFHFIDPYNSSGDNNFAGGDKVDDNPNTWNWTQNPVTAKDDINHALVHITKDASGHTWIVVAGDRMKDNGDSYIDFEFLQNDIILTNAVGGTNGGFMATGPDCGRTVNDFLLTLEFTHGGSSAGFFLSRWQATNSQPCGFDYVDAALPSGAAFAAVNTNIVSVPYGAFGATTYAVNTFAEAAVDLTAMLGSFNTCLTVGVRNIFIKTKASQSASANIVDFISPIPVRPLLVIGPDANAGPDQTKCSEGVTTTFTVNGSAQPGGNPLTSTNWTVVSGPASILSPGSLTTSVVVTGVTATATLRLTVIAGGSCTNASHSDDVVLIVNPPQSCSITGPVTLCPSSTGNSYNGPAGMTNYSWSISGNGTISGSTSGQTVSVIAGALCNHTLTLALTGTSTNGCSTTCSLPITVQDTNPPTMSCPGNKTNECGVGSLAFDNPTASDTCGTASISILSTVTNLTCGNTFVATRTWVATDQCGNTNTCSQTIATMDTAAPSIACSGNKTNECGVGSLTFDTPTASDTCGTAGISILSTVTNLTCGNTFVATRTWVATDQCGNTNTCSQTIATMDTAAPSISCSGNKTNECGVGSLTFDTPTASDTCGTAGISILSTVTNLTCGNTFVATRTWVATDQCGNTNKCSQTIATVDTTAPSISCSGNKTNECGVGSLTFDTPTASDTCGTAAISILSTVTNLTCGNTFVATRTWVATDQCGNTNTCSQTIATADTTVPSISCSGNKTNECGVGSLTFDTPTASDTCGTAEISILSTVTNLTCGNTFVATRTWVATDQCGNTNTCSQTIATVDTTAPSISCSGNKTNECGVGTLTFDTPTASDTCGTAAISILSTVTNLTCGNTFVATRTWVATDQCGNTNTCSQTIATMDTAAPSISCSGNKTNECGVGSLTFDTPTASDTCGTAGISILSTVTNLTCGNTFVATRTWVATDQCGNTNT